MTTSGDRRRELRATYEQQHPEAGVYLLRNTVTGRILVGSSSDLRSVRNRLDFGQATNSPGVLDRRMVSDAREYGMGAFALEVLDVLTLTVDMSPAGLIADLKELEALWREKLADVPHY
jgi:hypothetical protein